MERQTQHTAVDRGNFSPPPVTRETGNFSADLEKTNTFKYLTFNTLMRINLNEHGNTY